LLNGKLYIVATPIGNLKDITIRALEILKSVDIVACENTRHSFLLFSHYQIKKKLLSYNERNKKRRATQIIQLLKNGKDIALISDAGTPGISDPGFYLIREAIKNKIIVIAIPGPSAILTSLIVSGFPTDRFVFEGFLPRQKGRRRKRLKELKSEARTIIIFESPYRIINTLADVLEILGDRKICITRELTKIHEEVMRDFVSNILNILTKREKIKGEITLVIQGKTP
jgi:16S rRNA (cytidine1402-2'-O)-methyltransferase